MMRDYYKPGYAIKRSSVVNDGGIEAETFSTIATIDGAMRPLSARYSQVNEKLNYSITHCFYCDVTDIQAGDLICKDNKYYEVYSVNDPMDMGRFLQVECEFNKDFQEF